MRRRAELLALDPSLSVEPLRGNVDTRLRKMGERGLDAIVLSSAGLDRLGLSGEIGYRFSPEELLPEAGQGAVALQVRAGEAELVASADDVETPAGEAYVRAADPGGGLSPLRPTTTSAPDGATDEYGLVSGDGRRTARASRDELRPRRPAARRSSTHGDESLAALSPPLEVEASSRPLPLVAIDELPGASPREGTTGCCSRSANAVDALFCAPPALFEVPRSALKRRMPSRSVIEPDLVARSRLRKALPRSPGRPEVAVPAA